MNHSLENFKRINLIHFILQPQFGYFLNKEKTCSTWAVLEKEAKKLLVRNSPNTQGHWIFTNKGGDEKGTIIDFLLLEGLSMQNILKEYCQNPLKISPNPFPISKKETPLLTILPLEQARKAQEKLDSFQVQEGRNYLLGRDITREVIQDFGCLSNEQGALFPLYLGIDLGGAGRLCSTILYRKNEATRDGKYFQRDLPRGVAVLKGRQPHQQIVLTESPVDALAYEVLRRRAFKKWREEKNLRRLNLCRESLYLCTCGSLSKAIKKELQHILSSWEYPIMLAFDNDEAGKKMAKEVQGLCGGKKMWLHFPEEKDWGADIFIN